MRQYSHENIKQNKAPHKLKTEFISLRKGCDVQTETPTLDE